MTTSYSPLLVLASLAISIAAAWTALELSCRVHAQRSRRKKALWLGCGALIMGLGIWAVHYVGMLALRTAMPVFYYLPTVFVSMLAAVLASGAALYLVSRTALSRLTMTAGGMLMGGGIASMHYIGMSAMRMPCRFIYSRSLVALSLALAVVISMVALYLCFSARQEAAYFSKRRLVSALLMGLAVPSMHYVGMAAVRMQPLSTNPVSLAREPMNLRVSLLDVTGVIAVVSLSICFALVMAGFNRSSLAIVSKLEVAEDERDLISNYQQRLLRAYRQNGVGAWEWDPLTDTFSIDPGVRAIYRPAYPENTHLPRSVFLALVHPDDLASVGERWSAALAAGSHYESEYRILSGDDGGVRRCRSVATVARHLDGTVSNVFGMSWDVTAEYQQQQDYAQQALRFYVTLEAISEAVLSVDANQCILYANPVACELTGWSREECLGKPFTQVFISVDAATGQPGRSIIERCMEAGESLLSAEGILLSKTGARYNIQKHVNLVGTQGSAVITFRDITAALQLKRELEDAATHDSLTGLPNRTAFERRLQTVWNMERGEARLHCLALIDLDRFKLINDTAGHLAGDALLQGVVRALIPMIHAGDCLARMGGDEFLLLIRNTTAGQAKQFCQTLLRAVEDLNFVWQQRTYTVTASLGMVLFDQNSPSLEALTSQADVALFTSKRKGRNQSALYESSTGEAAGNLQQMEAVTEIRAALQQDRFELHAQPIVPLGEGHKEAYFELLLRMRDKRGALISPAQFIPAAECYGMMQLLDRWVIQKALAVYASSMHSEQSLRFAVNVSADSLSDPTLWNFVYAQFQIHRVPPGAITFEVTESGLIRNMVTATEFLRLAQKAGCRIALDDFGSGMSSLSYLKQFPLDVLKIDGAFIRNLLRTPLDQSIVRAVSQIAHSMGASTVGECAEDKETVSLLSTLGIDYVQGWATGKPEPLAVILQELAASKRPARPSLLTKQTVVPETLAFVPPQQGRMRQEGVRPS